MAKKPVEDAEPETITKTEAVRRALADGADTPAEGVAYAKEKFGLDITPQQFSTYKSIAKKKAGGGSAGRGRRSSAAYGNGQAAGSAALARDVKRLVETYGADAVTDMAKVFAE